MNKKILSLFTAVLLPFSAHGIQKMPTSQIIDISHTNGQTLDITLTNINSTISNEVTRATATESILTQQITIISNDVDIARISKTNNFNFRPKVGGVDLLLVGELAPASYTNISGSIFENPSASNEITRLNTWISNGSNTLDNATNNIKILQGQVNNTSNTLDNTTNNIKILQGQVVNTSNTLDNATNNINIISNRVSVIDTNKVNIDGSIPATADWSMNGHRIKDIAEPILDTDVASKQYVDAFVAGLSWQDHVLSFTTAPPAIVVLGDRFLVKPPATGGFTGQSNSIAEVTNVTPQAFSFLNPEDGWAIFVSDEAVAYAYSSYTAHWAQFTGGSSYLWGDGLSASGNTVYVNYGAGLTSLVAILTFDTAWGDLRYLQTTSPTNNWNAAWAWVSGNTNSLSVTGSVSASTIIITNTQARIIFGKNVANEDNFVVNALSDFIANTYYRNVIIGQGAAINMTEFGNDNIVIGKDAGAGVANKGINIGNVLIGQAAGLRTAAATGQSIYNTFIGNASGYDASGDRNTYIGRYAGTRARPANDNVVLGFGNGNQFVGISNIFIGAMTDEGNYGTYQGYTQAVTIGSGVFPKGNKTIAIGKADATTYVDGALVVSNGIKANAITNLTTIGFTNGTTIQVTSGSTDSVDIVKDANTYKLMLTPSTLVKSSIVTNGATNITLSGNGAGWTNMNNASTSGTGGSSWNYLGDTVGTNFFDTNPAVARFGILNINPAFTNFLSVTNCGLAIGVKRIKFITSIACEVSYANQNLIGIGWTNIAANGWFYFKAVTNGITSYTYGECPISPSGNIYYYASTNITVFHINITGADY